MYAIDLQRLVEIRLDKNTICMRDVSFVNDQDFREVCDVSRTFGDCNLMEGILNIHVVVWRRSSLCPPVVFRRRTCAAGYTKVFHASCLKFLVV